MEIMSYEPARDMFLARIPMARAATPEEIAGPCLYLASDDATYVTGCRRRMGSVQLPRFCQPSAVKFRCWATHTPCRGRGRG
ncbi:hypothetical protein B2J88_41805 [Rhodococcus sp. SRB_17]|nr:hypothetical protein [Rhodococcus sp. SRB_17]